VIGKVYTVGGYGSVALYQLSTARAIEARKLNLEQLNIGRVVRAVNLNRVLAALFDDAAILGGDWRDTAILKYRAGIAARGDQSKAVDITPKSYRVATIARALYAGFNSETRNNFQGQANRLIAKQPDVFVLDENAPGQYFVRLDLLHEIVRADRSGKYNNQITFD
jgi:hypothetical protein